MVVKLVIDADPGIGDAVAIAVALLDPEVELVGVTATAGRVSGPEATSNIQALIDGIDPSRRPRVGHSEASVPEIRPPVLLDGPGGLGDWPVTNVSLHHRHESARVLVELIRAHPHEITLLTLGPLTNVAVAAGLAGDFDDLLGGLVCLGGAIQSAGDVTAVAEFNVMADCQSARRVLCSAATKTLVPLDVSRAVVLSPEKSRRLLAAAPTRVEQFLERLLPFSIRAHHQFVGIEGVVLHEMAALAASTRPGLFDRQPLVIDVETGGELTRGMTVLDRRERSGQPANIEACVAVDNQGVLDYFTEVVQGADL